MGNVMHTKKNAKPVWTRVLTGQIYFRVFFLPDNAFKMVTIFYALYILKLYVKIKLEEILVL